VAIVTASLSENSERSLATVVFPAPGESYYSSPPRYDLRGEHFDRPSSVSLSSTSVSFRRRIFASAARRGLSSLSSAESRGCSAESRFLAASRSFRNRAKRLFGLSGFKYHRAYSARKSAPQPRAVTANRPRDASRLRPHYPCYRPPSGLSVPADRERGLARL
jgi:hypothetical protein